MTLKKRIATMVAGELQVEPHLVTDDADLRDDLGADSPHLLELALAIEEEFAIKVPDQALARMRVVADIVKFVESSGRT